MPSIKIYMFCLILLVSLFIIYSTTQDHLVIIEKE